ncbi:MAG: HmuY family protein [Mangrovibacterium sp.]
MNLRVLGLALVALAATACSDDEVVEVKDYGVHSFEGDLAYSTEIADNATHGDGSVAYTRQVFLAFGSEDPVATAKHGTDNWTDFNLVEGDNYNVSSEVTGWDLVMTYYIEPIQMGSTLYEYGVTGVLSNSDNITEIAKFEYTPSASEDVAAVFAYDISIASFDTVQFSTDVDALGRNWKSVDMNTSMYTVNDNLFYAIRTKAGETYKLRFTGFHGAIADDRIIQFDYALMEN